jgi:hypothetical protein
MPEATATIVMGCSTLLSSQEIYDESGTSGENLLGVRVAVCWCRVLIRPLAIGVVTPR